MTANRPLILVIEDDPPIRRFLKASLTTQDFELLEASTGGEGLALLAGRCPDVVLLDLGLPDIDGLEIIVRVREWSAVPIIIISARGQERDKIAGLDAGADDYVTKPFSVGELIARIRAALRRTARAIPGNVSSVFVSAGLSVNLDSREVLVEDRQVRFTPIEFRLLSVLVRHAGKVLTHKQLLKEVWGPGHTEDSHYLRIFIHQLRQKIETDPNRPFYLLTDAGVGYRLRAE